MKPDDMAQLSSSHSQCHAFVYRKCEEKDEKNIHEQYSIKGDAHSI